ncbi:hypothetical protein [Mesorhizobium sp. M0129]|uniref:hypothetical protein n=1 Tax=Mesorhizobium sp. M0129 TaxID=2956886 RepID=UPI00333D57D0
MRIRLVLAALMVSSPAFSQSVDIKIIKMEPDTMLFGEKKEGCKIGFSITNNSWGTIYRISVPLDATDDRGQGVDELLAASADNSKLFAWIPIAKGQTIVSEGSATFKESCKYISKITLSEPVEDYNCTIRMMPEEAHCSDVVTLSSGIDRLTTK